MTRYSRLAASAILIPMVSLVTAACSGDSGDKSASDLKSELSATLQEGDGGLSEEDADCFAGVVVDEIGADNLQDVDFDDTEPPAELQEEYGEAILEALDKCEPDLGPEEEN